MAQRFDLDFQELILNGNNLSITKGNTLTLPFANYYLASNPNGYLSSVSFSQILSKPTTVAGYGITDALTLSLASSTYFPIPTGNSNQYIRGNGTLATFPTALSSFNNDVSFITSSYLTDYLRISTAALTYAPIANPTFTGIVSGITKAMVGLSNVDNTSDLLKPISTATQLVLNSKEDLINKSVDTNLGTSNILYPTQNAVKTYIDNYIPSYTSVIKHKVKAGESLLKGQAVYVSSADGTNMVVTKASNLLEITSSKTIGLITQTLANNEQGEVVTEGLLSGLNTSSAIIGDAVWLGVDGNLIYGLVNKPYAPAHLVFIGIVTRVSATVGEIFVKVQNGFELNELHDVDLKTSLPVNGDILSYNGTLWVNKNITNLGIQAQLNGTGFVKATGTTITYDNTTYLPISGGTLTGLLTLSNSVRIGGTGTTDGNIYFGRNSFISRTTGTNNTALGANTLGSLTTGVNNIAIGNNAGGSITTGSNNIIIGATGSTITTGSNNIIIGSRLIFTSTGVLQLPSYTTAGFLKNDVNGNITSDSTTYLSTDSALSTYLPINNPTSTGTATLPLISNSLGANFAITSGNVGIGTTSPSEKLEVFGGNYTKINILANQQSSLLLSTTTLYGANNPVVELYNSYGNVGLVLYPAPSVTRNDIIYYDNTSKETYFQTNGSTKLNIKSNGNVLIGSTVDSGYKLDVNGTLRTTSDSYFQGKLGIGRTPSAYPLEVQGDILQTSTGATKIIIGTSAASSRNFSITNYPNGFLASPSLAINDETLGVTRLIINSTGNVGIGTTSPNAKLEVGGSYAQTGAFIAARNSGNSFEFGHINQAGYSSVLGANAGNGNSFIAFNTEAGTTSNSYRTRGFVGRLITNDVTSTKLLFQRVTNVNADNQSAVTDFTIDSNGNIGIGTASPSYLLDVNGTGRFTNTSSTNPALTLSNGYNVQSLLISHGGNSTATEIQKTGYGNGIYVSNTTSTATFNNNAAGLEINGSYSHSGSNGLGQGVIANVTNNIGVGILSGGRFSATANASGSTAIGLYTSASSTNGAAYGIYSNSGLNYFAGNVGIGTNTPNTKLDIANGSGQYDVNLALRNSSHATSKRVSMLLGTTGASFQIGADIYGSGGNDFFIFDNINLLTRFIINNSGNIGIGTVIDAGYKLDVNGTARFANGVNLATTSGNVGIGITPSYKLHVSGGNIYVGGADAGIRIEDRSLATRSYQLYVDGGALSVFNHNNSTVPFTITDGGNLGIGTTSPSQKLDVIGGIRATTGYLLDGTTNKTLSIETATNNRAFFGGWQDGAYVTSNRNPADGTFTQTGKAAAAIGVTGTTSSSQIEFFTTTTNNTLPISRMLLDGNGNVLIGTTTNSGFRVDSPNSGFRFGLVYGSPTWGNTINVGHTTDADGTELWFNYVGYNNSTTRFRDFLVGNGKQSALLAIRGSTGNVLIGTLTDAGYKLYVNGNLGLNGYIQTTNAIQVAANSSSNDPYGTISVTQPITSSYSYYGLTRTGNLGMGMGITTSNEFFIGTTTAGGASSVLLASYMTLTGSLANFAGSVNTSGNYRIGNNTVLDVSGNYTRIWDSTSSRNGIWIGNASDPANYYDNTQHIFRNRAGDTVRVLINSSGNIGIGTLAPNAPLQFSNVTVNRKIVFWEVANNDHQFYGFGLNSGTLRYQTPESANHIFYSATGTTASQQLFSINGNQTVTYTPLTTTQINALTGMTAGTVAYNSTLGMLVVYNGTAWKRMDGTTNM